MTDGITKGGVQGIVPLGSRTGIELCKDLRVVQASRSLVTRLWPYLLLDRYFIPGNEISAWKDNLPCESMDNCALHGRSNGDLYVGVYIGGSDSAKECQHCLRFAYT